MREKGVLKVNVLLRQENKTKKKEQGNSKSQKGWAVKEWFLFFGELKVLTGHRRNLYGHYPCSNHWSFFGFMFRPSLDRVFAKEGELRGFLNLLFRFFSKGGWGSRSSHTNFLSNLLETKTFFTIFFWIPELSFTRALLQHALWLLLVFFWFLQVLVLLSVDLVVYSCSELLLLYYCVGRCFLGSLSEKKKHCV